MSEGHPEFLKILQDIESMHKKKSSDYGIPDDIFLNIRQSMDWGVQPWVGSMVRAGDKVVRLKAAANGSDLKDGSCIICYYRISFISRRKEQQCH
jgi:hypothetical protein